MAASSGSFLPNKYTCANLKTKPALTLPAHYGYAAVVQQFLDSSSYNFAHLVQI